jgi:hypothetical protein
MADYSVVENPDGPVFVAVTQVLNPYRKCEEPVPITNAVNLDRDADFVRFCCVLDGFIAFMSVVMFLNLPSLFPLVASAWGYHGVKMYDHTMLLSFLIYQYLYSIGRWGLLGYAIWYNFELETDDDYRYWCLMTVLPIIQTYITWRVQTFYNTLKNIYINNTAHNHV